MLTLDINFLRLITYISIDINVKLKMYIFGIIILHVIRIER